MPNYINPYAIKSFSRSIGTTSARSTSNAWGSNIVNRASGYGKGVGAVIGNSYMRSLNSPSKSGLDNAWGNNIANRDKIELYTRGSEIAPRAKIGLNKFNDSFNSGAGTFGGSNFSSYNNKLLNKDKDINSFGNSYMRSLNSF